MKQYPILFSTPMVQAILVGEKTMTRRTITPHRSGPCETSRKKDLDWDTIYPNNPFGIKLPIKQGAVSGKTATRDTIHRVYPPYKVGDRLWVRETWMEATFLGKFKNPPIYQYKANMSPTEQRLFKWKPSIFMPRGASRITLEITDVLVERLQDITPADAEAEGITWKEGLGWTCYNGLGFTDAYRSQFYELWQSINGQGSWEKNPWVWVIKFWRVKP